MVAGEFGNDGETTRWGLMLIRANDFTFGDKREERKLETNE